MKLWIKILLPALAGAAVLVLMFCCHRRRQRQQLVPRTGSPEFSKSVSKARSQQSLQAGIAKLQLSYRSNTSRKAGHLFDHHAQHHEAPTAATAPFNWDDRPGLVVEAVENGWSRFTFAAAGGRPPADSLPPGCAPAWGLCIDGAGAQQDSVVTNWEVPAGSSEFMQTVRLNPRPRRSSNSSPLLHGESVSTARMLLPLPGPPLAVSSFPQEAYFEITIIYLKQQQRSSSRASKRSKPDPGGESDRTKLIACENSSQSQRNAIANSTDITTPNQEPKSGKDERGGGGGKQDDTLLSLGFTHGGALSNKSFSGTYPGSIGFHSNGAVYLDGMKLVFESEKAEWAEANRVIGCGFDPRRKKVFFTVDAELMHVIHCNSDTYKAPLYPVLGANANADAMVLVNLGQSRFKYEPANASRTPNPCFVRSLSVDAGAAAIAYEDSRELFSMGRIDAEWFEAAKKSQSSSKKSNVTYNDAASAVAADVDADSDLFEISLHI